MARVVPPPAVVEIARTLEREGFEAWCVGGAVRDAFLGIETLDWDLATSARPEAVQRLFRRTVPVGLPFGTVGVLDRQGVLHEVTTFRHDVETDGRHAVVRFGASLDEDLARRDFTVNAIAVHPERLEVRDPFGGRADLSARVIRCVGDPSERMREDRLRALRALRFAGRFEFTIEPATWAAIVGSAPHLGRLSMERVKQELEKVMAQVARPARTLERYRDAGIFGALIPGLADAPSERFAAVDHLAYRSLPGRPGRVALRLAALFAEPGVSPPPDLERVLKALRFSNVEARLAVEIARAVAPLTTLSVLEGDDVALRRWVAEAGRLVVPPALRVVAARAAVGRQNVDVEASERERRRRFTRLHRRAMGIAWRDPLVVGDLAVDGEDLRRVGITDGRAIGVALRRLLEVVLEDPRLNTVEALLDRARQAP